MKQSVNPVMAAVAIILIAAVAGFFIWRGVAGPPPGDAGTDPAVTAGMKKTTQEIPAATGAAPGMTAPPQQSGGGVSTPLMPSGGMTAPNNTR